VADGGFSTSAMCSRYKISRRPAWPTLAEGVGRRPWPTADARSKPVRGVWGHAPPEFFFKRPVPAADAFFATSCSLFKKTGNDTFFYEAFLYALRMKRKFPF
jgi:hypothetical protein